MNRHGRRATALAAVLFYHWVAPNASAAPATSAAFIIPSGSCQRPNVRPFHSDNFFGNACRLIPTFKRPLHASSSNMENITKGRNREKELERLAQTTNVAPVHLKELLAKQRSKMDPQHLKAQYIDWLLAGEKGSGANGKHLDNAQDNTRTTEPNVQNEVVAPRKSTRVRPNRPITATIQIEARIQDSKRRQAEALKDPTLLTNVHFAERKDLHPDSKRALTQVMGLTSMTEIQSKTFEAASSGRDVLGRARTGTGKTIAFLLPAIERVLQSGEYQVGRNVGILVISPTRELATQIADEAEKLLTFHRELSVQVVYGGTKMGRDVNQLKKTLPTILVATPGRLNDHLESTVINGRKFGADIMASTPVLVLDETDRLLDMGFRRDITQILTFLPRSHKRQTLLFSATIPPELKKIMAATMKPDFIEVDCINDGDGATHTNARVQQSHVIIPSMDRYVSSVVEIVCLAMEDDGKESKIVVFFPTARMVSFFAALFNEGLDIPVIELHSKKRQGHRNKASAQFRSARSGVLFTSDVSARGVDYPGVSHVIQFGIPESREQYIHRLGRTGRAGAEGKGWMVLGPFESLFLEELKGLDVPNDNRLRQLLDDPVSAEIEDMLQPAIDRIRNGDRNLTPSAEGAYQAFLGYYLGQTKRMKMKNKNDLVRIANRFSSLMGLSQVPALAKNMVEKMGLKGVDGIVVKTSLDEHGKSGGRNYHVDGRRAPNSDRHMLIGRKR